MRMLNEIFVEFASKTGGFASFFDSVVEDFSVSLCATRLPDLLVCAGVKAGFFSALSSSTFFLALSSASIFATGAINERPILHSTLNEIIAKFLYV